LFPYIYISAYNRNEGFRLIITQQSLTGVIIKRTWRRVKMKLLGLLIFVLGLVLKWFTSISLGIAWALIIVGAIILIAGYLLKSRAS